MAEPTTQIRITVAVNKRLKDFLSRIGERELAAWAFANDLISEALSQIEFPGDPVQASPTVRKMRERLGKNADLPDYVKTIDGIVAKVEAVAADNVSLRQELEALKKSKTQSQNSSRQSQKQST